MTTSVINANRDRIFLNPPQQPFGKLPDNQRSSHESSSKFTDNQTFSSPRWQRQQGRIIAFAKVADNRLYGIPLVGPKLKGHENTHSLHYAIISRLRPFCQSSSDRHGFVRDTDKLLTRQEPSHHKKHQTI